EVLHRSCEPIEPPDQDRPKPSGPRCAHQPVESGPALPGAREATIDELLGDVPATSGDMGAQGRELTLRCLAIGTHASVKRDSHRMKNGLVSVSSSGRSCHL